MAVNPKTLEIMNSNNNEQYNFLDSLPESLVLEIFNRLRDFKTLIQCSAVCHCFSSLIYQVDTVFLQIFESDEFTQFSPDNAIYQSLNKFPFVINIYLEFIHTEYLHDSKPFLLKCKVLFGSEANIEKCIIFYGVSNVDLDPYLTVGQQLKDGLFSLVVSLTHYCLETILSNVILSVSNRVCGPETLSSVVITDSWKLGKLIINKKEISKSRNLDTKSLSMENSELQQRMDVKLWFSPVLSLPLSGHNMMLPMLFVIRPGNQTSNMQNDFESVCSFFDREKQEEEEKMFYEAVMAVMNNSEKMTFEYQIPSFRLDLPRSI